MKRRPVLSRFQTIAAREIAALEPAPAITPPSMTVWVASSLLQKSIRRNRPNAAKQAGRILLEVKRERLFRRLNAIASEDIGLADIQTVAVVSACLASKKNPPGPGGDEVVTDYLIGKMCAAQKNRAADDLLMALETWPGLAGDRIRFATMTNNRLRTDRSGLPIPRPPCTGSLVPDRYSALSQ